jgi:hypothetical protein
MEQKVGRGCTRLVPHTWKKAELETGRKASQKLGENARLGLAK